MFFNKSVLPQNTGSKLLPVSRTLEVGLQGSEMFPWQTYFRGSADTLPRSPLASTATCLCVRAVSIRMGRPGVIINGPFFQRHLVWIISSTGILPLTKWPIFNVHFKPYVQITGSADSPAAGLAPWRGGMTSEYPGGTVVSEVTVLLTPRGRSGLCIQLLATHRK